MKFPRIGFQGEGFRSFTVADGLAEDYVALFNVERLPPQNPAGQLGGKVDAGGLLGFEIADDLSHVFVAHP